MSVRMEVLKAKIIEIEVELKALSSYILNTDFQLRIKVLNKMKYELERYITGRDTLVVLPSDIEPKDLDEILLPDEGIPIVFIDNNNDHYCGAFIWSSMYKFFANSDVDSTTIIHNVVKWKYLDI